MNTDFSRIAYPLAIKKATRLSPIDTSNGYDPYNSAKWWRYAIR